MSLIIEGQNGVGKTTLCNALKFTKFKSYDIYHMTANEPNTFKFYNHVLKYHSDLILDRGPIGELVYSELYGRKSRISFAQVRTLLLHTPCYYLKVKPEQIYKNLCAKGEQNSSECNMKFILEEAQLFEKYANKLPMSIIPYDFNHIGHYIQIFRG